MNYKIEFDINLEKALAKIPKRDAKLLKEKIESLAHNPRPHGSIKLSGKELYRIRYGIYRRIIYKISDEKLIVLILDVDGRKDVYKKK